MVAAMARPATRGQAMAGLFLVAFVGLAVSAVGIGLARTTSVPSRR
jgi:hypothetical protein